MKDGDRVNSEIPFLCWKTMEHSGKQENGPEFPELIVAFLNPSYTLRLDVSLAHSIFSTLVYMLFLNCDGISYVNRRISCAWLVLI